MHLLHILPFLLAGASALPAPAQSASDHDVTNTGRSALRCPLTNSSFNAGGNSNVDPRDYTFMSLEDGTFTLTPFIIDSVLNGWNFLAGLEDENDPIPADGLVYNSLLTVFELHVTQYGDDKLHYYHLKTAIKILKDHFKALPGEVKVPSQQVYILSEETTVQGTVRIAMAGATCSTSDQPQTA